jgi:uncharacterized protein YbjQ (UPF0145 family)
LAKPDVFVAGIILAERQRTLEDADRAQKERERRAKETRIKEREAHLRNLHEIAGVLQDAQQRDADWIDLPREARTRIEEALKIIYSMDLDTLSEDEKLIYKTVPDFKGRASYNRQTQKAGPKSRQGNFIITTETYCPDLNILERKGIVTAECSFGQNFISDFAVGVRNTLGGRSRTMQKAFRDSRDIVLEELEKEARAVDANAVIGVTINYTDIAGSGSSMLLVVASGTAALIVHRD